MFLKSEMQQVTERLGPRDDGYDSADPLSAAHLRVCAAPLARKERKNAPFKRNVLPENGRLRRGTDLSSTAIAHFLHPPAARFRNVIGIRVTVVARALQQ
jgi:hypothetical protein